MSIGIRGFTIGKILAGVVIATFHNHVLPSFRPQFPTRSRFLLRCLLVHDIFFQDTISTHRKDQCVFITMLMESMLKRGIGSNISGKIPINMPGESISDCLH